MKIFPILYIHHKTPGSLFLVEVAEAFTEDADDWHIKDVKEF